MPTFLSSWIEVLESVNLMTLSASGDWMRYTNRFSFLFEDVGAQVFFWILMILIFNCSFRLILSNFSKQYQQMNSIRQTNVIIYLLEILFSFYAVLIVGILLGPVLFKPRMQYYNDHILDDFSSTPQWLTGFQQFSMAVGYGILPMMTLYACELIMITVTKPKIEVFIHHAVTIILFLFIYRASQQCVDVKFIKLGFFFFYDAVLEQPIFMGLLCHRFNFPNLKNRFYVWCGVVVFCIVWRSLITSLIIYSYWDLCWNSIWITEWAFFFKVMLPPLLFILVSVQVYCIYVYILLALRSRRIRVHKSSSELTITPSLANPSSAYSATSESEFSATDSETQSRTDLAFLHEKTIKKNVKLVLLVLFCIGILVGIIVVLSSPRPFSCAPRRETIMPQRIAIIGGGIAGMSAAFSLAQLGIHRITIYESNPYVGGHAVSYINPNSLEALDLGVVAFTEKYHNFFNLIRLLNLTDELQTIRQQTTVSFNFGGVDQFFGSSQQLPRGLPQLSVSDERLLFAELISVLAETLPASEYAVLTLGDVIKRGNFSYSFTQIYLRSCLGGYSFTSLLKSDHLSLLVSIYEKVEDVFGLCRNGGGSSEFRFKNGMSSYTSVLADYLINLGVKIELNTTVTRVLDEGTNFQRVQFQQPFNMSKNDEIFDQVIIASDYKTAMKVLDPIPGSIMHKILSTPSNFYFSSTVTNDTRYFPTGGFVQGCWYFEAFNFEIDGANTSNEEIIGATLNPPFTDPSNCYTSLSDISEHAVYYKPLLENETVDSFYSSTAPEDIHAQILLRLTTHDPNFITAGKNMHKIQGRNGIWFAGGAFTTAIHEFAHVSGLVIATAVGGAPYPYQDNALGQQTFLAFRNWMLYGMNPFVPILSKND